MTELHPQDATPRALSDLGLIARSALFSECETWRYWLRRSLNDLGPKATWIMLNPSTAGAFSDDPTTTQCMHRMFRAGYTRYEAVNLFALVGTDPACLHTAPDPVGQLNDRAIRHAVDDADLIVVAWGRDGALYGRAAEVLAALEGYDLWCLGHNNDGSPRFPRAVPRERQLVPYRNRGAA